MKIEPEKIVLDEFEYVVGPSDYSKIKIFLGEKEITHRIVGLILVKENVE